MKLYRLRIRPLSPWRTPWQADTLTGLLCWACARRHGPEMLRREILQPALAARPRFVLSDACPSDLLPCPVAVRLQNWPAEQRKQVKRCRWITRETFRRFQQGQHLCLDDLQTSEPLLHVLHQRNTIARDTNTTGSAGSLFSEQSTMLRAADGNLTIYVRLAQDFRILFLELLREIAQTGFGADISVGKGQFDLVSDLEPADDLDTPSPLMGDGRGGGKTGSDPIGLVVLSTFQPGPQDPTDGAWETFTKYGKLGPDFGLENVFKRPLIMFRPGACFRTSSPHPPFVGRAIPMSELLAPDATDQLRNQGVEVTQLAFGLCIPTNHPLSSPAEHTP